MVKWELLALNCYSTVVDANPDKVPFIGSLYNAQYLQKIYLAAKSLKMASGLQNAVLKTVLERQAEAEQMGVELLFFIL